MRDFTEPIPQELLNIENKTRSNLFAWRGQFSPQLIEHLLESYCPPDSVVLDPFVGSGTVLHEAARAGLQAFGYDISPSAWSFAKLYEFVNVPYDQRDEAISEVRDRIDLEFPTLIFSDDETLEEDIEEKVIRAGQSLSDRAKIILNALVIAIDAYNNRISNDLVQGKFLNLTNLVQRLPFSESVVKADLRDARDLPLQGESVDFVLTSPPYINVFNYHQNYRRSVEILGWNPLRVARSEIGSNRANRANRFITVIQYCIDMASALYELARVLVPEGKAVIVIGYESNVLGVPFYNADIIERIARSSGLFELELRQQRAFGNRFGSRIREDLLNLRRATCIDERWSATELGRRVARDALSAAVLAVPNKNYSLLMAAASRINEVQGTIAFDAETYSKYQTRGRVMMVKEKGVAYEQ